VVISPQQTGAGRTGGALYRPQAAPVGAFAENLDARAAQLVRASSDADPFGIDPRGAQQVS
jgi:hypothetical protein